MKKECLSIISFFLVVLSTLSYAQWKGGGVEQLIETRSGRTACWGIVVHLHKLTFVDSLSVGQIKVVEAKFNSDVVELMDWSLDRTRKNLTVKFKAGKGNFGTGNSIKVTIDGAGFIGSPEQTYEWTIPTDPM